MLKIFDTEKNTKKVVWVPNVFGTLTPVRPIGSGRGQLFSTDALLALIIFAFALTLIGGITSQLVNQTHSSLEGDYLSLSAKRMAQTLFSSPGEPWDWDTRNDHNSVTQVGVMGIGGEISFSKWNAFQDWNAGDYFSLKQWLGISDKNFYITIWDLNKTIISRAGISPSDSNAVSIRAIPSVYEGKNVVVQVQVYE